MSVDRFYLVVGFTVVISVIFGILSWRTGKSPDHKSRVDAWFEVLVGAPACILFGWLTAKGFIDGEVWFGARGATPVLVQRAIAPETFWLAQGIGIVITVACAFMAHDGLSKLRRRYLGG